MTAFNHHPTLFDDTAIAQAMTEVNTLEASDLADFEDYRAQARALETEEYCEHPALRHHGHSWAHAA